MVPHRHKLVSAFLLSLRRQCTHVLVVRSLEAGKNLIDRGALQRLSRGLQHVFEVCVIIHEGSQDSASRQPVNVRFS